MKKDCTALYQIIWVNRLSKSNLTSVQKTNKAMATKCNRVVTQEKRRKSIGEGREKLHFWGFQEPFTSIALYQSMYWDRNSLFFLICMLYRGFLPFANLITANFITVIIQKNP